MVCTDDVLLKRRADDLMAQNALRRKPQFLGFLDERQKFLLTEYFASMRFTDYRFYGGHADALRCFLGIDIYTDPQDDAFPITMLEVTFRRQDILAHRDFLGSLMAQGITRESVGDILVTEGKAALFLEQSVAAFVLSQVRKIGRVGVKIKTADRLTIETTEKFELLEGTVPSLRLDCIASLCTGLSREKTKLLLTEKQVRFNYQVCQNPSQAVRQGDQISIRSYGKFILDTVGALTKKGRCHIILKHYI